MIAGRELIHDRSNNNKNICLKYVIHLMKNIVRRRGEDIPVPDWSMMGMTMTQGKLIGLGNITRDDLPAALDER